MGDCSDPPVAIGLQTRPSITLHSNKAEASGEPPPLARANHLLRTPGDSRLGFVFSRVWGHQRLRGVEYEIFPIAGDFQRLPWNLNGLSPHAEHAAGSDDGIHDAPVVWVNHYMLQVANVCPLRIFYITPQESGSGEQGARNTGHRHWGILRRR